MCGLWDTERGGRIRRSASVGRIPPALCAFCVGAVLTLFGCRARPEPQPTTQVEALRPADAARAEDARHPAGPADTTACDFVEREARKLDASFPRQLDADTAVTRVHARGCALTLEYQLLTLAASDVAPSGLLAMRERVTRQLCDDAAARATLERGGTFTNVYRDRARAHVGQFTVARGDCKGELFERAEERAAYDLQGVTGR